MPNTYGSQYGQRERDLAKAIADEIGPISGGGGGGGGDASAANQLTEIASLESIRDRLPSALDGSGNLKVALPDAATATNQATQITALGNIFNAVDTVEAIGATQIASLESIRDRLPADLDADGGLLVHLTPLNFEAAIVNETALTAVGSTQSRSCAGYSQFTYQAVVASIGTNVVVRVEGNLGGSGWANLNVNNTDTTIAANGTYIFTFTGKLVNIRFTLVSLSGGTPSVTASLLMGN